MQVDVLDLVCGARPAALGAVQLEPNPFLCAKAGSPLRARRPVARGIGIGLFCDRENSGRRYDYGGPELPYAPPRINQYEHVFSKAQLLSQREMVMTGREMGRRASWMRVRMDRRKKSWQKA